MKIPVKYIDLEKKIFAALGNDFSNISLEVFKFQYQNNEVYHQFCNNLNLTINEVNCITKIPFLPIEFFKTHKVATTSFQYEKIFESSSTTSEITSKHYIKDVELYKKSFTACFQKNYGLANHYCIIGLLPSYLQRKNSSLVMMVDDLIKKSNNKLSGFYLDNYEMLYHTLKLNESNAQPTILIGVTYALLDFAEKYSMQLKNTIVMETGGMKGRREEMTRTAVHELLQNKFGLKNIHSEYGMTEMLSQAYSKSDGVFHCPEWMQICIREEDDPLATHFANIKNKKTITGAINIIDLANLYSCSFIASSDVGKLYSNLSFEVLGRLDNSDIRGCSLMAL